MIAAGLAVLAGCYVMGGIPFGVIVGKLLRGIDIRDFGSGNIGASNVLRILGPVPAAVVLVCDTAKGLVAVLACVWLFRGPIEIGTAWSYWVVAGAMLSIIGHSFSVFLSFSGGKGVATSLGVVIGLSWQIALVALGIWLAVVGLTRYISAGSIAAAVSVPLQMVLWKAMNVPAAYQMLAALAALVIIVKHSSNMKRLIAGTESRIGQRMSIHHKDEEDGQDRQDSEEGTGGEVEEDKQDG